MADSLNFTNGEDVAALIARELADAPLYSQVAYTDSSDMWFLPETIVLFCETCDKDTNSETYISRGATYRTGFAAKEYICRNCKTGKVTYHYYWGKATGGTGRILFFKIGQWPALEERIPRELKKNLELSDLSLYSKAFGCRNQKLGLGSLS